MMSLRTQIDRQRRKYLAVLVGGTREEAAMQLKKLTKLMKFKPPSKGEMNKRGRCATNTRVDPAVTEAKRSANAAGGYSFLMAS